MIPIGKNPPARFPDRPIHEAAHPWWVAKVKPRQEKALAFDFMEKNIAYYLPMYTKVARRRDNNKPRKTILCLFPGYISFCPEKGFERSVFSFNRIVNIIEVKNQSHFVKELEQIYRASGSGAPLEPFDTSLVSPGQVVAVTAGPMRGLQGTVVKIHNNHKLILSVDVLGKAAVSIDSSLIKPV